MRPLTDIEACFQGVIPSYLATCSEHGEPNVTCVSILHLLGPNRVGVSCQFMNKTLVNLRQTGRARVTVLHPQTAAEYQLELRFEGLLEGGVHFDKMAATLAGIASQSGMQGVFKLAGVAEFEVLDWGKIGSERPNEVEGPPPIDRIAQVERILAAMDATADLDSLLDQTFAALDRELGLSHGFLLFADGSGERLYTLASHGFEQGRFGAEVAVGEGVYGTVAARRTAIRSGSLSRERLMARAVARESAQSDPTSLELPGLPGAESSVAVPLLRAERCIGVLCFQSELSGAFTASLEQTLQLVARHLSAMIAVLGAPPDDVEVSARRGPVGGRALVTRVKYFESDGSVFLDDGYLIKGVAGRILFRVLANYVADQRDEFSSKEIRLDPDIGLPALKDNLEARLIALRKRLIERTSSVRIEKTGRGRFRLEVGRELVIERRP